MLDENDLHALRGLVRAHVKRRRRSLDGFKPKPGQDPMEAAAVYDHIVESVQFYVELHDRVREAENAKRGDGTEVPPPPTS